MKSDTPADQRNLEDFDIEDLPDMIGALRARCLTSLVGADADVEGEEFCLLALAALDQAQRFANLCRYKTRQARAREKGSWP